MYTRPMSLLDGSAGKSSIGISRVSKFDLDRDLLTQVGVQCKVQTGHRMEFG